jgi:putative flippase GtrA
MRSPPLWAVAKARLAGPEGRFIRFLAVGALNTAFGYLVFAVAYLTIGSHRAALVIATVIGVLFNFVTTGRIVFGSRDPRRLLPFVASYVVSLGLNFVLLELLVRVGAPPLVGQIIALPMVVVTTYVICAKLVFRHP